MNLEDAKRKIRAILSKAEEGSGATEAEAQSALAFARRLMLQHQLSEDELSAAPHTPEAIAAATEYGQAEGWCLGMNASSWEGTLALAVAALFGTVGAYRAHAAERRSPSGALVFDGRGQPKRHGRIMFYGPEADCRDASAMFEEWTAVIAGCARLRYGGALKGEGRAYAGGFASALYHKAEELQTVERQQIAAAPSDGASLVLVRQLGVMAAKKQRGEAWLASQGIRIGAGTHRASYRSDAYGEGKRDGSRADFKRSHTRRLK